MTARSTTATPRRDKSTGTWGWVFDSVHPRPDGTRRQVRRRGFATKAEAQAALDVARRDDAGLLGRVDGLTVGAVLGQFVRTKRLAGKAPGTVAQYEWAAGRVAERFGTMSAERLTAEQLDAFYAELLAGGRRVARRGTGVSETERPMSPRSVAILHKTVKAAYALAVDKGQLVRNPARLAVPPATPASARPYWTPEQVGAFIETAAASSLPCAIVEVLADTGARRGEVLGLRWADIDLDAGTLTISRQITAHPATKALEARPTKRPRSKATVGLHPATVEALRRRKREQSADRLRMGAGWPQDGLSADLAFTWPDGRPIHPDVLTRTIKRLSAAAGLPVLTAHGLRHSFATAALKARVPVEVVAARLGNTPRVVQEVYAHVIPADDQAAAVLVGDLYRATGDRL